MFYVKGPIGLPGFQGWEGAPGPEVRTKIKLFLNIAYLHLQFFLYFSTIKKSRTKTQLSKILKIILGSTWF